MTLEDNININSVVQNIILENKKKLTITGTRDVISFDDELVIIDTELRTTYNKRG